MSTAPARVHKRAYQACIPCRERRVRCDLGSVDSPHDGPCGRCRRERKFCHFSATRGKKKAGTAAGTSRQTTQQPEEGYLPQSDRPSAFGSPVTSPHGNNLNEFNSAAHSLATRIGIGNGSQIKIPQDILMRMTSSDYGPQASSSGGEKTVAALLRDAAYTSHDALKLLWEAGRHSERDRGNPPGTTASAGPSTATSGPIRPSVASSSKHGSVTDDSRQPWSNLRFVRTGLFTAEEAIELVNYFHAYLAPFTPISSSSFQDPSTHPTLLEEEPILAVTILTLASRYMKFSGAGSISRSYMVHERLWQHLQGMISRMIFGQEQFAGATHDNGSSTDCSGQAAESALAGSNFGSLRTLGTCEALLLLSEWHPRSLNVPAGDDGDSIIVKDDVRRPRASTAGIGGRIRIDWLEPVWRSDRMCWSMLGNALALAVELGIFDEYDNTTIGARESRRDIWNDPSSSQRAYRVQHLLWVYLTQTSGRLGWKNLTSVSVTHHEAGLKHGDTIRCWIGVASLMKRGNELLFTSRDRTKEMVRSGEYLAILRVLNPLLREWQVEFDRAKLSKPMRAILSIEYGYVRVSINSVALQAVIEHRGRGTNDGTDMRVSSVLNTFEGNKEYFMEVVFAARAILQTVVEDLVPNNRLRHVPIRTYSRILAGAMFCLKAFALGVKDEETIVSLELVERTAEALCTCVVDDVHLSNRFGELLTALASSLRSRVMGTLGNEHPQSGNMTAGNTPSQRNQFEDRATSDIPITANNHAYDPPVDSANTEPLMSPKQDYSSRGSSNVSVATSEPSGYLPMHPPTGTLDQISFQHDPLMSFAGLGPNQLGWSGGQDFFDMLGPLLDVQYEQYR
ncbi:hypothetical protein RJZ56_005862 [Blastomyces dermatitidis]|uniref:C6 transcription factor n=1 Tax=Blastomyces gilchristii (strain SLH14081) TaxID=559298 RepID=A0A179UDI3_BLAGS|nr:C6 transcription factor [Blastomyces gilchristii SLH14081]OAT05217.1 C6 transcription factor [Blastomyces gilchristii SLH14081]